MSARDSTSNPSLSEFTVRYNRTMLAPRDVPLLPVFVAVAESGSFTAAARELGLGKSVVSKHIRTLEERCGVSLMVRSTRTLRLTQTGERVLAAAKDVLASVRELEKIADGHRAAPTGTLRVTMPIDPSLSAVIAPIAAALTQQYANLKIDFSFDDAVRNFVQEGFDVAIRVGLVIDASYVVRRLGSEPEIIVGSPIIASKLARAATPQELHGARWIVHSGLPMRSSLTFRSPRGDKVQVAVKVIGAINTALAMRDLLVAGVGFGILPLHVVRDELTAGRLCHVCPGWISRHLTLQALLPTRQSPPRVRIFLDRLASAAKGLGFAPA